MDFDVDVVVTFAIRAIAAAIAANSYQHQHLMQAAATTTDGLGQVTAAPPWGVTLGDATALGRPRLHELLGAETAVLLERCAAGRDGARKVVELERKGRFEQTRDWSGCAVV